MKTLKLKRWGNVYDVTPVRGTYENNGSLFIGLRYWCNDGDFSYDELFYITVNLEYGLAGKLCAHIDTNNMDSCLEKDELLIVNWLEENGFGKVTEYAGYSGYCSYPLFAFDEKVLKTFEKI